MNAEHERLLEALRSLASFAGAGVDEKRLNRLEKQVAALYGLYSQILEKLVEIDKLL